MVDDVTDLRFLDEEKIVGSFSNGSIALYKYRPVVQVTEILQLLGAYTPM